MIKIAVLCPSEIAFRRFMPALTKIKEIEFVGIGHASEEEWFGCVSKEHNLDVLQSDLDKAKQFVGVYGGIVFNSFESVFNSKDVDAIYIPLPPGLHFKWAKRALECGKHVLVEKPSTTCFEHTKDLVDLARVQNLAIHENYMFAFHSQLYTIKKLLDEKTIGDIRLYRISFGFPFRGANDFRYNKKLGGGALLDCGGYTIKLANMLLGQSAKLVAHQLNYKNDFEVDIYGSGTMVNDEGQVAQISFGMDNSYKCDLEVWGSNGTLFTGRVLTAPEGFRPVIQIKTPTETIEKELEPDDSFKKSIQYFLDCISDHSKREESYNNLLTQSKLVDGFKGAVNNGR